MAEWLAEQGVDVTHIMAPAALDARSDRAPPIAVDPGARSRARVANGQPPRTRTTAARRRRRLQPHH